MIFVTRILTLRNYQIRESNWNLECPLVLLLSVCSVYRLCSSRTRYLLSMRITFLLHRCNVADFTTGRTSANQCQWFTARQQACGKESDYGLRIPKFRGCGTNRGERAAKIVGSRSLPKENLNQVYLETLFRKERKLLYKHFLGWCSDASLLFIEQRN